MQLTGEEQAEFTVSQKLSLGRWIDSAKTQRRYFIIHFKAWGLRQLHSQITLSSCCHVRIGWLGVYCEKCSPSLPFSFHCTEKYCDFRSVNRKSFYMESHFKNSFNRKINDCHLFSDLIFRESYTITHHSHLKKIRTDTEFHHSFSYLSILILNWSELCKSLLPRKQQLVIEEV